MQEVLCHCHGEDSTKDSRKGHRNIFPEGNVSDPGPKIEIGIMRLEGMGKKAVRGDEQA